MDNLTRLYYEHNSKTWYIQLGVVLKTISEWGGIILNSDFDKFLDNNNIYGTSDSILKTIKQLSKIKETFEI